MPTIPIFKDNQTFTAGIELEKMPQHSIGPVKNIDDSSIFIYNQSKQEAAEPQPAPTAAKRKPLGVLVDNEPEMDMDNYSTMQQTTTDSPSLTTKILEFEPPAASTRNIRPLLNKMGMNKLGMHNELLEDSELDSFLCAESNKDNEKRLSNILAQDFPTASVPKWNAGNDGAADSKTPSNEKQLFSANQAKSAIIETERFSEHKTQTTKQVKFNCDASNMTTGSVMTRASGHNFTNMAGENISWDYEFMQMETSEAIKQSNQSNIKVSFI